MELREKLRDEGVRPPIKRREFRPIDHAHNARVDGPRYTQRAMCETVFSTTKRTLGDAMRAWIWHGEFRELALMYAVHNIKKTVTQ
jgi:IS5 family transposase